MNSPNFEANSVEGEPLVRVLVVDDDEGVRWTLKEILEVYGFAVDVAASGEEALRELESSAPDCILMDIVMPGQSGIEVFRQIKLSGLKVPVIFMTGYAHYRLENDARLEGAVDIVAKPIDMKKLVALIRSVTLNDH